mmetsp:Transcript_17532/g.29564  ORF Transcript_17532/g.29564 Transcript_17532/m.29564 type:complete len:179 (+) Transcript_17532:7-543(+)
MSEEKQTADSMEKTAPQDKVDKEEIRRKILEEARKIRVRRAEGKYENDNPDLEYKSKWAKKLENLEDKFKDVPKISFHKLDDEGNLKYLQLKRDMVWTTIGWSFLGNIAGIMVVRYLDQNSKSLKSISQFRKRETLKVCGFLGSVALLTLYGYGTAKQRFVREKIKLVDVHSIEVSGK